MGLKPVNFLNHSIDNHIASFSSVTMENHLFLNSYINHAKSRISMGILMMNTVGCWSSSLWLLIPDMNGFSDD